MTVVEGGPVGTAAGFGRRRPRRSRVRREPIDLERITAEFSEPRPRPRHEILAALEAEVERVKVLAGEAELADATAVAEVVDSVDVAPLVTPTILIPLGPVGPDESAPAGDPAPEPIAPDAVSATPPVGLPLDQLRAWLDQVESDLQKVQLRLEFLHAEQHRLQGQHRLVEDLIASNDPV